MNPRAATDWLVVHCSATRPSQDIGAEEIRRYHTAPRPHGNGWDDIGYHIVIRRDGRMEPGRALHLIGAHVAHHNHNSIGICLVGGLDEQGQPAAHFTRPQMAKLELVLTFLAAAFPGSRVRGHRDFPGVRKACPSFDAITWANARGLPT